MGNMLKEVLEWKPTHGPLDRPIEWAGDRLDDVYTVYRKTQLQLNGVEGTALFVLALANPVLGSLLGTGAELWDAVSDMRRSERNKLKMNPWRTVGHVIEAFVPPILMAVNLPLGAGAFAAVRFIRGHETQKRLEAENKVNVGRRKIL